MFTTSAPFTFTSTGLFGTFPQGGVYSEGTKAYQGETLSLRLYLTSSDGKPVSEADHTLTFVLKKALQAENTMVRISPTATPTPGVFDVEIPAASTSLLAPGSYYYAVQATHKGTNRQVVLQTGTVLVELSAASPNPKPSSDRGELTADGESVTPTTTIYPPENSGPFSPDVSKPL